VALPRIAALSARRLGATLHAVDSQSNVSTRHAVDRFQAIVMEETHWTGSLLDYCLANKIRLVIPARHSDLGPLAEAQSEFKENGVHIAISSEATISICTNKLKTYEFLENHGFPTPFSFPLDSNSIKIAEEHLPFIAKPIGGSASSGIHVVDRLDQLSDLTRCVGNLGQRIAQGAEYTINS
jgi:carbamoyl-phosphate synthase large subunit